VKELDDASSARRVAALRYEQRPAATRLPIGRVTLADGRSVFVKSASSEHGGWLRRDTRYMRRSPAASFRRLEGWTTTVRPVLAIEDLSKRGLDAGGRHASRLSRSARELADAASRIAPVRGVVAELFDRWRVVGDGPGPFFHVGLRDAACRPRAAAPGGRQFSAGVGRPASVTSTCAATTCASATGRDARRWNWTSLATGGRRPAGCERARGRRAAPWGSWPTVCAGRVHSGRVGCCRRAPTPEPAPSVAPAAQQLAVGARLDRPRAALLTRRSRTLELGRVQPDLAASSAPHFTSELEGLARLIRIEDRRQARRARSGRLATDVDVVRLLSLKIGSSGTPTTRDAAPSASLLLDDRSPPNSVQP